MNALYSPNVARILIAAGADINLVDHSNRSALFITATNDCMEIAKLLIRLGADIHYVDQYGNSALVAAVAFRDIEVVKLLIEAGAKIGQKNQFGECALDEAIEEIKHEPEAEAIIDLIKQGLSK